MPGPALYGKRAAKARPRAGHARPCTVRQTRSKGKAEMCIRDSCDMVGHTGVFDAAVKAVEAVDKCVGEVTDAVLNAGGVVFLTADHGNAEKMKNPDGSPFTAHTTNVVPFAVIGAGDVKLREGGCLADIAPTMLPYIGLPVPEEMTGKSIIAE